MPTLNGMATVTPTLVRLSRGYVEVTGPEAADFLERMVSNEVASLEPGEARRALLLTPKGRIVAPLRAVREGPEAFLLITEAELAETLASTLAARSLRGQVRDRGQALPRLPQARRGRGDPQRRLRRRGLRELGRGRAGGCSRRASSSRCASTRPRRSGAASWTRASSPPRRGSTRRTSRSRRAATPARSRSRACTTAATRTGGCGCSRSRARARATRSLHGEKVVGRVTSAVPGRALGYVRREVSDDADPRDRRRRGAATLAPPAPVAQGIERCPAEAEVASSNLAGRIAYSLESALAAAGFGRA